MKALKELCDAHEYLCEHTDKESAIMYNAKKFNSRKFDRRWEEAKTLFEGANLERESGLFARMKVVYLNASPEHWPLKTTIDDRACVACGDLDNNKEFLAVSWHGPLKVKEETRKKTLRDLQDFLIILQNRLNCPFIMGGDFNLNTAEFDPLPHILIPGYEMCPRSEKAAENPKSINFKDNFIIGDTTLSNPDKRDGRIGVLWVRQVDLLKSESKGSEDLSANQFAEIQDITKKYNDLNEAGEIEGTIDDVLDHDPIVAELSLHQCVPRWKLQKQEH